MPEKLNPIRTRPRFKIYTDLEPDAYVEKLKLKLKHQNHRLQGNINTEVANIWVKTQHNEYWKPYLSLRIEKEEDQTVLRGIFGPSSAVWTFFMFLYFIFGIIFMVFITLWFITKQIKSSDFPWAIYLAIFSAVCLALIFIATKIGQQKAKKEMEQLRDFAESAL